MSGRFVSNAVSLSRFGMKALNWAFMPLLIADLGGVNRKIGSPKRSPTFTLDANVIRVLRKRLWSAFHEGGPWLPAVTHKLTR